ncbi:protein phosphatase 2C and cyclic nucleotide-binding/kinase domain-containing protein-like isoform X1 [Camellia sinensis]|uniref:protein phosphatase 2C and cyclic nucleotide-binding/kinase domain-containing protein-like isoform X1 n=1 Tax=Camellia sinensis TaxID=4442 RepID=UPI0010364C3C|nr:protein phosphatase 2C and cyclic nucleotide-binding/kinase domain-containing protein-like isoform X1 [Camellia sinensis]XP_028073755.1 protein phosphatase 2C and cyclic nucleotide-binding/kinase domain-containing protein-like isoform X1 [Camellia sinensis]
MQLVRGNGQGVHCTCKEEKDGEVPRVLHLYTAERLSSFGELALMNNKPLQASVRAVTSGTLWALKREDFRGILTSEFSNLSSLKLLRSIDLLSRLTILQMRLSWDCTLSRRDKLELLLITLRRSNLILTIQLQQIKEIRNKPGLWPLYRGLSTC